MSYPDEWNPPPIHGFTIEGPLPHRSLSSNGARGNWRGAAKHRAVQRAEWRILTLAVLRGTSWTAPERVNVDVHVGIRGGRGVGLYQPRDATNALAALKGAFDGIVDGGGARDDSAKHWGLGTVTLSATWGPGVRVTIKEAA